MEGAPSLGSSFGAIASCSRETYNCAMMANAKKGSCSFFSAQVFPCYYKLNQPNIICLFINFYEPSDLSTRNSKKPHVILLCRNCYKSEIWNDDELILLLFYLTPLTAQAGSLITPPTSSAETPTRIVTPLPYLS